MSNFLVRVDDPALADVQALLNAHLTFARRLSPPEAVHALDVDGLRAHDVSFFSIRMNGDLLGIGTLKQLDRDHGELKSMHTAQAARGNGVGRAMLDHLVSTARARGYGRVSLETGSMAAFAPARALYASAGFELCEPFGAYAPTSYSVFMTLGLSQAKDEGIRPAGPGTAHRADPAPSHPAPSIDASLVRRLVASQFPQWADLPVSPVDLGGWDNRTFRLGDAMTVRLPSAEGYTAQLPKEQRWLPILAPQLPLPIPLPVAKGAPAEGYPYDWSIYRWLDGDNATVERIGNLSEFASTLAGFLNALQRVDAADGPPPGQHSAFRGGPLETYDAETRRTIDALQAQIAGDKATAVWEAAIAATWQGSPVWFHGDVSAGNLLVRDGRLAAVIDFGCSGVGDPACDVSIAWTLFSGESREVFRRTLSADSATWARGRGWALWKALITLAAHLETNPAKAATARRVIDHVLADHLMADHLLADHDQIGFA